MLTNAMRGAILATGLAGAIALSSGCAAGGKEEATVPEPMLTLDSVWNAESRERLRAKLLERVGKENPIYVDRALETFDHAADLWREAANDAGPRKRACLDTSLLRIEAAVELVGRPHQHRGNIVLAGAYRASAEIIGRITECRSRQISALYARTLESVEPAAAHWAERALARASIADAIRDEAFLSAAAITSLSAVSRTGDARLRVETLLAALDVARYPRQQAPDMLPPISPGRPEGIIKAAETILPEARAAGHLLAEAELLASIAEARLAADDTNGYAGSRCCAMQLASLDHTGAPSRKSGITEARQALEIREQLLGDSDPGGVMSDQILAVFHNADAGVEHLVAALTWQEQTLGPDHLLNAHLHRAIAARLAEEYAEPGDEEQLSRAIGHVRRDLGILRRAQPVTSYTVLVSHKTEIELELAHRDLDGATSVVREAVMDGKQRPNKGAETSGSMLTAETVATLLRELCWQAAPRVTWWGAVEDDTDLRWLHRCIGLGEELGVEFRAIERFRVALVGARLDRRQLGVAIDVASEHLATMGKSSGPESGPDDAARASFAAHLVESHPAGKTGSWWRGPTGKAVKELGDRPMLTAARKTLLEVLEHRGVKTTRAARRKIAACDDLELLYPWIGEALTATSLDEVFYEDAGAGGP